MKSSLYSVHAPDICFIFLNIWSTNIFEIESRHLRQKQHVRSIRPAAVKLVDSLNFYDQSLNSTLDRYDGKVYEAHYVSMQNDMSNQRIDGSEMVKLHLRSFFYPFAKKSLDNNVQSDNRVYNDSDAIAPGHIMSSFID
jgi:hypothetical protein